MAIVTATTNVDNNGNLVPSFPNGTSDDTLVLAPTTLNPGDSFDGRNGTDTILLSLAGTYSFNNVTFSSFEALTGSAGTDEVQMTGTQFTGFINGLSDARLTGVEAFRALSTSNINLANQSEGFVVTGSSGNDTIVGGSGNDTVEGGAGNDSLNGGAGAGDWLSYEHASAGVTVSLALTTAQNTGGAGTDTVSNFENLRGSGANDSLTGSSGANVIAGGLGNDTLTGGLGADTFVRDASDAGAVQSDTITDFAAGTDKIDLSQSNGPASYEVLVNHLLRSDGSGNAQLISIWNSSLQTLTLTGIAAGSLAAGDFVFDTSAVARTITGTGGSDQLYGGLGGDVLSGGNGNDLLVGDAGDDQLFGEAGADRFDGGAGADTFTGGAGIDRVDYNVATTLILNAGGVAQAGSSAEALGDTFVGIEYIRGSALDDNIDVSTAVGILWGYGGNDTLTGGAGSNEINGGAGNDVIHGGGSNGSQMVGDIGYARVEDDLFGGDGEDTILTETLAGQLAYAFGDAGNDTIIGGAGNDGLFGGDGADSISGGAGINNINGGAGNDVIHGGGASNATTSATESLFGGDNDDTIYVETLAGQRAYVYGDAGNDTLIGGAGNDELTGGAGADSISGGGGTNRMFDADGASSGDRYEGGSGRDDIIYSGYASGATLDFSLAGADSWDSLIDCIQFMTPATVIGSANADNFAGVGNNADTFYGGGGNDWLTGNGGNDYLSGGANNDRLDGGLGSDTLIGGAGSDVLNGGIQGSFGGDGAADQFQFAAADFGTYDVIRDFEVGLDTIGLVGTGLTAGAFDPGRFFAVGQTITGTAAALLYDQGHGVLYFDADGSGAGAALGITLVTPNTALTASSIVVV